MRYTTGKAKDSPPVNGDAPTLPNSVQSYLDNGAPEGERNKALFSAATQLRDIGQTEAAAIETLTRRAVADGLKEGEARSAIRHAFAAAPRPAPQGDGTTRPHSAPSRREQAQRVSLRPGHQQEKPASLENVRPAPLPAAQLAGIKAMLLACFKEGEGVCIAPTRESEDGRRAPERGVTLTREKWLAKIETKGGIEKCFTTKHGLFLRVNPMRVGGKGEDADVTAFRHVLVEFDKDGNKQNVPKETQYGAFLHSQLPISAVLDSGNKSVHAWVRVDAKDATEYAERVETIFALFDSAALDPQNKNPSRFSRCPDGWRHNDAGEVVRQSLLTLDIGTKDWNSWLRIRSTQALGEPLRFSDILKYDVPNDPNAVLGVNRWICRGGSVIFVSQSGIGKSSLNMQLCIGWALARPALTFGIPTLKPLKSIVLQAENDDGDVSEAGQGVAGAHNLTEEDFKALEDRILFYRITTLTGAEFCRTVEDLVLQHRPDICWIDPLLNFIGDDVSDAAVIAQFCTGWLNEISRATGVIFALIHHTGKPQKEARSGGTASDAAYAGLGSSALTNWAREVVNIQRVWTPEGEPPTFSLTACKRRKRAGMKSMETGEVAEEIFIRHASDGRIAWEQCVKPDDKPKGKRGAAKEGGAPAARSYTLKRKGAGAQSQAMDGVIDAEVAEGGEDRTEAGAGASSPPDQGGRPGKLSRADKAEIVRLQDGGELDKAKRAELAARFGVSIWTIDRAASSASGGQSARAGDGDGITEAPPVV